jgi:hypothetical protein
LGHPTQFAYLVRHTVAGVRMIGRPFTSETARTRTTWVLGMQHQRGAANNAAKLDGFMVELIRKGTTTNAEEARIRGVSVSTIERVRRRLTWKHIA